MNDPDTTTAALIVVSTLTALLVLAALKVTAVSRRRRRAPKPRRPTRAHSRATHSPTTAPPQTGPTSRTTAPLPRATLSPQPPAPHAAAEQPGTTPAAGPGDSSAAAQIVTRTGPNTSGAALVDPYATTHRPWTPAEDHELRTLYYSGLRVAAVAQTMRIDQRQVAIRLITLLLAPQGPIDNDDQMPNARTRYTPTELTDLTTQYLAGDSLRSIADRAGRSQLGVGWRLLDLGTPRTARRPHDS